MVGLEKVDVELHPAELEKLWGLSGARRKTTMLRGGTTFLKIVQYETPAGRPRPLDDRLDRQGFKTLAVGYRDPAKTGNVFERVKAVGLAWTVDDPVSLIGGNHVIGAVAHHMKTLLVPFEIERQFGYSPAPQKWWHPPPTPDGIGSLGRTPLRGASPSGART